MPSKTTIYQLKVTIKDIRPPIWRRIQVESSTTLSKLHLIIQAAMGWYNYHAKRACPPEDCGGAWGYTEFLEAIQDPTHPEHESFLEWVGGNFDSEFCGLQEINQRLTEFETLAQHWL